MSEGNEAEEIRQEAIKVLRPEVEFENYLWGAGEIERDGTLQIGEHYSDMDDPEEFVKGFARIRKIDTVSRLFLAFPKVVQVIPVIEFWQAGDAEREEMFDYLAVRHGIANLMVVGTRSSYGYAWITFYRLGKVTEDRKSARPSIVPDVRFTQRQAEFAARVVPYYLYRWQRAHTASISLDAKTRASIERAEMHLPNSLLALSADQLSTALDIVQNRSNKTIASKHEVGEAAIRQRRRVIRKLLDIKQQDGLLDKLLGDL